MLTMTAVAVMGLRNAGDAKAVLWCDGLLSLRIGGAVARLKGDLTIAPVGDGQALDAVLTQEVFRDGADGVRLGGGRPGQAGGPGGGQGGEGGDLAHMTDEATAVHAHAISP